MGNGGDYLAFPVLADMAVEIPEGSGAEFSDITVSHFRAPGNIIYRAPGVYRSSATVPVVTRSMPEPDTTGAVTWARGWLDMPAGRAECSWRVDGDRVIYKVTVPEGVEARFFSADKTGDPLTLAPGHHQFTARAR